LSSTATITRSQKFRGLFVSGLLAGFLISQSLIAISAAQEPFQFDAINREETLRDQQILREQMQLQQEILRQEMEKIRVETQKIMKDISLAMKEEAVKLKEELVDLQKDTTRVNKEILETLENAKKDFSEGREEMRKELENMRKEAKSLTKEISVVLEDQQHIWKEETVSLQDSLLEAKADLAAAQADTGDVLESTREAYNQFQEDKVVTMNDSKDKSGKAMDEAGQGLQKSKRDYKKASEKTAAEILAGMKEAKDSLKRRQALQKKDAANANRQVLASIQKDRLSRNAELQNSKLQNNANLKKAKQFGQSNQADTRQASLRRANTRASAKARTGPKTDGIGDDETGDFGDGVSDARGVREFSNDQQPSLRDGNGSESQEGLEVALTLEDQKKRFFEFGNRIKILKKQIEAKSGNASPELIELGYAYLEAQRFIDSRDDIEKVALLQFANKKGLPLGSYEQAAWAFKIALTFNTNKAETHLQIGKIYDEVNDGDNPIMYSKLAHLFFKKNENASKMEETQNFIESLTIKYEDKAS
jgi:hypothetical protein